MPLDLSQHYAQQLDAADPLARFRERFHVPAGTIYLDGNSLGLLSVDAERRSGWMRLWNTTNLAVRQQEVRRNARSKSGLRRQYYGADS